MTENEGQGDQTRNERRSFTQLECIELQELNRVAQAEKFKAMQVKGNTALVPDGQEVAKELEAIAMLMENARNIWVAQKLVECGWPEGAECNINLSTGEVTPRV